MTACIRLLARGFERTWLTKKKFHASSHAFLHVLRLSCECTRALHNRAGSVPPVITWSGALQYTGQLVRVHVLAHEHGSQERDPWLHSRKCSLLDRKEGETSHG